MSRPVSSKVDELSSSVCVNTVRSDVFKVGRRKDSKPFAAVPVCPHGIESVRLESVRPAIGVFESLPMTLRGAIEEGSAVESEAIVVCLNLENITGSLIGGMILVLLVLLLLQGSRNSYVR